MVKLHKIMKSKHQQVTNNNLWHFKDLYSYIAGPPYGVYVDPLHGVYADFLKYLTIIRGLLPVELAVSKWN